MTLIYWCKQGVFCCRYCLILLGLLRQMACSAYFACIQLQSINYHNTYIVWGLGSCPLVTALQKGYLLKDNYNNSQQSLERSNMSTSASNTEKENPRIKMVFPKAMDSLDPSIDLLNAFDAHECTVCLTPLQKFTKIVAQRIQQGSKRSNQGFQVYCVPCFSGWSKFPIDLARIEEATYRYFVCRRTDGQIQELGGWSPFQILQLQKCLQNFGPEINPESRQYFIEATQNPRKLTELANKYKQLNKRLFEPNSVGLKSKTQQTGDESYLENDRKSHSSSITSIIRDLNLKGRKEEEKQAHHFLKLIHHRHPIEKVRKYADVPQNYFCRAIVTNSPKHSELDSGEQENYQDKAVSLLQKLVKEKAEKEKQTLEFTSLICRQYATLRRRNRKLSQLQQIKAQMKLEDFTHPELQPLLELVGKEQFNKVMELRKERDSFVKEMKEKRRGMVSKERGAMEANHEQVFMAQYEQSLEAEEQEVNPPSSNQND